MSFVTSPRVKVILDLDQGTGGTVRGRNSLHGWEDRVKERSARGSGYIKVRRSLPETSGFGGLCIENTVYLPQTHLDTSGSDTTFKSDGSTQWYKTGVVIFKGSDH